MQAGVEVILLCWEETILKTAIPEEGSAEGPQVGNSAKTSSELWLSCTSSQSPQMLFSVIWASTVPSYLSHFVV